MLLSGGYTVYTSFDMDLQNKLQQAVDDNLAGYTEVSDDGIYKMQGAAVSIDNSTGNVDCRRKKPGSESRIYVEQGISELQAVW